MNLTNEELAVIALYHESNRRSTLAAMKQVPLELVEEPMLEVFLDARSHLEEMSDEEYVNLDLTSEMDETDEMEDEYGEVD